MIATLLNTPWSLIGLCAATISIPYKIQISHKPFVVIFFVRSFWWRRVKRVRASAIGSVILCGPLLEEHDIEHELVHVEQMNREPFIHPLLYLIESLKYGYRNNKYEIEAYDRSGNVYRGKEKATRKGANG